MKSVAVDTNVYVSTISLLLDTVNYSSPSVPECISIDEFKGNTDAGKFQCILVDAKKHCILDILPDRTQKHLSAYFPNATILIDKYHFIRYVTWAIENVRKRLQKKMPSNLRRYYKRNRKLIGQDIIS